MSLLGFAMGVHTQHEWTNPNKTKVVKIINDVVI